MADSSDAPPPDPKEDLDKEDLDKEDEVKQDQDESKQDKKGGEEEEVSCCPPGSHGEATVRSDRPLQGSMTEIPPPSRELVGMLPLPCYCTGAPLDKSTKRVVVVFTDVYGIDAGHHKVFADCLAERLDCSVIVPDLFRGVPILQPWIDNHNIAADLMGSLMGAPGMIFRVRQYPPAKVEQEIFQMILPFIHAQTTHTHATDISISCVGFCFGGWVVGRVLGHQPQAGDSKLSFQCGVGIHPSFQPNLLHAEQMTTMAERIHKPILFLPAWNDGDLKPNTKIVNIIQQNLTKKRQIQPQEAVSVEFPNMIHGWVSRGDPTNPAIAAEQEKALKLTVDFIQKHSTTTSN
ncbi:Dienelactone hydrolase family protein [Seminavis robusta]|uniref:Dienelactone hydrolase family protein n=1 Tax=Seminavis robusta TaxID=568900 RepID=A0A9N8DD00_9STRA|nr:Dienelactone hydrolase family protein [Seminavis robusta]|eukprot:Sro97_g049960.1 Dienelactone hydrolase family protein (348) ;mRNA; r:53411-54454